MKRFYCIATCPVRVVAKHIHHKQRIVIVSVAFMTIGPFIATLEIAHIPRLVLDSLGYLIHACGCAPLAESLLQRL